MAPALFTRMSMWGKSFARRVTLWLSDRSAGTVSTETLALRPIDALAFARSPALRATSTRWHPSAASVSAAARPIPFEAPVINAVLPVSLRSMALSPGMPEPKTPARPNYDGRRRGPQHAPPKHFAAKARPAFDPGSTPENCAPARDAAMEGGRRVVMRAC